jgi:haloalkane dehalogenase
MSSPILSRVVAVDGETIHYLASGPDDGPTLLFLHGNPTSSAIWRRSIETGLFGKRCIAPDMIGMGDSSKPRIAYSFADHARFLANFIAALGLEELTIVAHDWGVPLGIDLARTYTHPIAGLAFIEGRLEPLRDWSQFDDAGRSLFQSFRQPGVGERLILDENMMLDTILQAGTLRALSEEELDEFKRPFPTPESRRPLLAWTRSIPIAGEPAEVTDRMAAGWRFLCASDTPKLALIADPGAIVTPAHVERWRTALPNLTVRSIGAGGHFAPLDQPEAIAIEVARWDR